MGKRKKRASESGDLTIGITVTVRVNPDAENVGTYSVDVAIDGPETVVGMMRGAYERGRLNHGIEAFVSAALRPLTDPVQVVISQTAGRA